MSVKVKVNPEFNYIKDFLKSLPTIFDESGETLKDDRNEIKVIEHDNLKLCIKSFKRVTVFNRYMYSWFRGTKAKRSYKVARRLEKNEIDTPKPVGYVEVYGKWHILKKAYYVSLYLHYDFDMKDVLDKTINCQEKILTSFAREMATVVHPAGAWHNDLSSGNVLINMLGDDKWSFSFIDLNRLTFRRRISPVKGLANFKKLTDNPVALALIAEQYALEADKSVRYYSLLLQRNNLYYSVRRFYIKRILSVFKPRKKMSKDKRT
ncbi:MAG: hypothetical protein GX921_04940 [Bacteroidales bacterium]|nr:hypothetical protein [Bacteroidales bacterium]